MNTRASVDEHTVKSISFSCNSPVWVLGRHLPHSDWWTLTHSLLSFFHLQHNCFHAYCGKWGRQTCLLITVEHLEWTFLLHTVHWLEQVTCPDSDAGREGDGRGDWWEMHSPSPKWLYTMEGEHESWWTASHFFPTLSSIKRRRQ